MNFSVTRFWFGQNFAKLLNKKFAYRMQNLLKWPKKLPNNKKAPKKSPKWGNFAKSGNILSMESSWPASKLFSWPAGAACWSGWVWPLRSGRSWKGSRLSWTRRSARWGWTRGAWRPRAEVSRETRPEIVIETCQEFQLGLTDVRWHNYII